MIEFLTAGENLPFTVSLTVMVAIAVLEGVAALLGMGISGALDALVPDVDLEVRAPDLQDGNALSRLLGWLRVGEVPVLMLLVVFLTGFGLLGLGLQSLSQHWFGVLFPSWLAAVPAFVLALPVVRVSAGVLARLLPGDETDALPTQSLVGQVAVITLGRARQGSAAEAKLRDVKGQTHYVMVEPDVAGEEFQQGEAVVLVARKGAVFTAIRNPSPALVD